MMRSASLLFVFLLFGGPGARPQATNARSTAPSTYRILGKVVNARDDAPVPRCHMTAEPAGAGRQRRDSMIETDSDAEGNFVLEVPGAGDWQVRATAYGIRSQAFQEHDGFYTGVVLTTREPVYSMTFRATPDAVLSGTVTDEAGEPVREAQVSLFVVHPEAAQTSSAPLSQRETRTTDDRGYYEFANLDAALRYKVRVMARPWYADQAATRGAATAKSDAGQLDPSLDVVYPLAWYPGSSDNASAEAISAPAGEHLQADFRLFPVPSAHLVIPASGSVQAVTQPVGAGGISGGASGRISPLSPSVLLIQPGGGLQSVSMRYSVDTAGNLDISGLVPGTYRVTEGDGGTGPQRAGRMTSTVVVRGGGSLTDIQGLSGGIEVTIAVDGGTPVRASEILLVDAATGMVVDRGQGGANRFGPREDAPPEGRSVGPIRLAPGGKRPGQGGPMLRARERAGEAVTLTVPPGRYEVRLAGGNNSAYLTGISAIGAEARGRFITVGDQPVKLTVHLAAGLANVEGTAMFGGKPAIGAMLLLIPATLGSASSLTIVRRDQTNTDGGFSVADVIPGQYILLAIEDGWGVRWEDPATLGPYLMRGAPLDLRSLANVRQTVEAQSP